MLRSRGTRANVTAMDGVLDGFLRSIRALNDDGPGTAGARKREPRRSSVLAVTGGVCGIGAKIGQQGGRVVVTKTSPTGPAAAAGVAEGDIIRQVCARPALPSRRARARRLRGSGGGLLATFVE